MDIEELYYLNLEILQTIQEINNLVFVGDIFLAMLFLQRWIMSLFRGRSYD